MEKLTYRADIDGLRAIAVVLVILFHYELEGFAGGFVGVDVFFVISGFLITRMIRAQVAAGRFSFTTFYVRRARRLFPALFTTIVACFAAAYALFSPQHLERFGGSALHALLAISNFFFWSESGYFDADAAVKPLLHTWSLAVEEQFYLLWPALLVLLLRRSSRAVLLFLGAVAAASLYLGERWIVSDEAAAFFLLPSRVVELALGAAMVWAVEHRPRRRWLLEPLVGLGLALILYAAVSYSQDTPFPGWWGLVPCIGTALVVYAGEARYSGAVLRHRWVVAVGLISYSLYLVHWPILVFYRYYKFAPPSRFETWALIAASFGAATLMYRLIENPIRHGIRKERHLSAPAFGLACGLLTVLAAYPAAHVWARGGWVWRLPEEVRAASDNLEERRLATWRFVEDEASRRRFGPSRTSVLVLGDSHGKDLFNALHQNAESFEGLQFRFLFLDDQCYYLLAGAAPPAVAKTNKHRICVEQMKTVDRSPLVDQADYVLISTRWRKPTVESIEALHRYVTARGPELVLTGRTAEFENVPALIARFGRLNGADRYVATKRKTAVDDLNALVRAKAEELGVRYLDKLALICSEDRSSCDVQDAEGRLIYLDYGHWTLEGAAHFGRKMAESGFLAGLRPAPSGPRRRARRAGVAEPGEASGSGSAGGGS